MKKWAKWFGAGTQSKAPFQPDLPVDLLGENFIADPVPTYAWLRENAPVAEIVGGGYLLTRHADIRAAFSSVNLGNAPSRFSVLARRNREKYVAADLAAHIPPFLDKPEHTLPRQALTRAFFDTFKTFEARAEAIARDHCALWAGKGRIDLLQSISRPFACRIMSEFIGLAQPNERLKQATGAFFHLFAPIKDAKVFAATNEEMAEVRAVVSDALAERLAAPGNDLISNLLAFQAEHPTLTDAQIVDNTILVLADGIENIEAGAATILRWLLAQPEALEEIKGGTLSLETAIREVLRLDSPGQVVPRVCRKAFTIQGVDIGEGVPVFLALGSANRDANVFKSADQFLPLRDATEVVTFGMGRHRCIGEQLGLMQFNKLTVALLDLGAKDASPSTALQYAGRFGHRWPVGMPITLG